jgi:hypothetical protein
MPYDAPNFLEDWGIVQIYLKIQRHKMQIN